MMNYSDRFTVLNSIFTPEKEISLPDTKIDVRFFPFVSSGIETEENNLSMNWNDRDIFENKSFGYPVFVPRGTGKSDKAILLLHGLNERSWNKYLSWAEYLCEHTGKPVILFPIAFHINRTPQSWFDPRSMLTRLNLRRKQYSNDRSVSLANLTLSERLSENPQLFYTSGRQTLFDLEKLCGDIKEGKHPIFTPDTHIDLFAYSIGAFLSQILLMVNPEKLFTDTRLFMFCGGSIFSAMQGVSRSIMDRQAFENLHKYYVFDFEFRSKLVRDRVFRAFNRMISPDREQTEREQFFNQPGRQIQGISLKHDTVIPYSGVLQALGNECTRKKISLFEFPFPFTHENPFPLTATGSHTPVNEEFVRVFSQATAFLA